MVLNAVKQTGKPFIRFLDARIVNALPTRKLQQEQRRNHLRVRPALRPHGNTDVAGDRIEQPRGAEQVQKDEEGRKAPSSLSFFPEAGTDREAGSES